MLFKIRLFLLLSLGIVWSCDKSSGPSFILANDMYITVLNAEGEDLLDPEHPSTIDLTLIKVYYELDGVKTEINRGNLDFPQMYVVEEPGEFSDYYRILLFLNTEDDSEVTTTYFEWNSERTDVIRSQVSRGDFGVLNDKIWLNDEMICDVNVQRGRCNTTLIMEP